MNSRKDLTTQLDALRTRLGHGRGKSFWRTLEEAAEFPEFQKLLQDEFPDQGLSNAIDRRRFLTLMGASLALAGLSGCSMRPAPEETLVPYVRAPEEIVPGRHHETASAALTWQIGAGNTLVLLMSSLTMALAVHHARHDERRHVLWCLGLTAILGLLFLCLKAVEYTIDYRDALIPGWRFHEAEWVEKGLTPAQTGNVELFLIFYWIMTGIHAVHMVLGIAALGVVFFLARQGAFSTAYYTPIDAVGLYWHFVDIVWIFLLPILYLQGTHANVF